jgi:tRNA U34 2-thiouridine synthase MnmA/TrmU
MKLASVSETVAVALSRRAKLSRLSGLIAEEQGARPRYVHFLFSPKVNALFGWDDTSAGPAPWAKSQARDYTEVDLVRESDAWLEAQGLRALGQFWVPDLRGLFDSEFMLPHLIAWARSQNIAKVSTGHRARVLADGDSEPSLWRSRDLEHDQSAWLAHATRKRLVSLFLPLGYLKLSELSKLCVKHSIAAEGEALADENSRLADFEKLRSIIDTKSLSRVKQKGYVIDESQHVLGEHAGLINFYPGAQKNLEAIKSVPAASVVVGCDLSKQWLVVAPADKFLSSSSCLTSRVEWAVAKPALFGPVDLLEIELGFKNPLRVMVRAELLADSMLRLLRASESEMLPFAAGRRVTLYRASQCLGAALVLESYR